jgi:hypothetical protein
MTKKQTVNSYFNYKDYLIEITQYLSGVNLVSARSDNDYFTKRYMDDTRADVMEKVKQLINERTKQ